MTNRRKTRSFALALALALLVAGVVLAQTGGGYDLTWWTVDGGGGTVEGGGYTLMSSAGQPDAAPPLSGGGYTLTGGFWSAGPTAPSACTAVTDVDLTLLTSGDIYTDTLVAFSADVAPDNAHKPYTYTIDYDDGGATTTATSSDDPLTTPLDHTFATVGTHNVEIKVWNCAMTEAQARTDALPVVVSEHAETDNRIYLPLVVRNH